MSQSSWYWAAGQAATKSVRRQKLWGGQFCPQPAFSRPPPGLWLAAKSFVFNATRTAKIFVKRAPEHGCQPQVIQSGPAGGPAESRLRAKLPAPQWVFDA